MQAPRSGASRGLTRARRRLLLALAGDLAVLIAFLYVALGMTLSSGEPSPGEGMAEFQDVGVRPTPAAEAEATPGVGALKSEIEDRIAAYLTEVSVTVLDPEGDYVLSIEPERRFELASVAKVYILAAYLDKLEQEGTHVAETDLALMSPMIRASDNAAASTLWHRIGREEGLSRFLASKGLPSITTTEEGAWGTLNATSGEVGEFLWMLADGRILGPDNTALALNLLSRVNYDQSWGISAGLPPDGGTRALKNGWYPENEGWRINSAGVVQRPEGDYVLVIFAFPVATMERGIAIVEDLAARINELIGN